MMRVLKSLALILLLLTASRAEAGPSTRSPFGVGLDLNYAGAPFGFGLGLTGKYWQNATHAYDFGLWGGSGWVGLAAAYEYHKYYIFSGEAAKRLPVYFGGGGYLIPGSNWLAAGVQGKLGLSYLFKEPFDVYGEVVPTLNIIGGVAFNVGAHFGGRFYF